MFLMKKDAYAFYICRDITKLLLFVCQIGMHQSGQKLNNQQLIWVLQFVITVYVHTHG